MRMKASAAKHNTGLSAGGAARLWALVLLLLAVFFGSFFLGRYGISPLQLLAMLAEGLQRALTAVVNWAGRPFGFSVERLFAVPVIWTPVMETIVLNIRLPRILMACLVGCCLSTAGACYQGVFQNPMASPDILGASSGAAFGAALAILLGLPNAASSLLSGFASTFSNQLLSGYGTDAIAAMGAAGKLTMLTGLVQMGIVMGVQPMMAYCYGAGDIPRQRELLKKLSQFTFGLGTGFTVVCYIARRSLLGLFLQAGDAVRLAELFSIWLLLSGPVIGLYYIASNYLQATGSALSATVVSVLRQGALLIPLLYLMHAGFGLPGIAIAHALADLIATGIGMALFLRQYRRVCQSAVK